MWLVSEKYISKHEIKLWVNNNLSITKYDNFGLSVTYVSSRQKKLMRYCLYVSWTVVL